MIRAASLLLASVLAMGCGNEPTDAPLADVPVRTIEVTASIGGDGDSSECAFGSIERALLLPDGNVLVLDIASSSVRIFTREGDLADVIGSPGPGPGEFGYPSDMTVLDDGTIAVSDAMKAGILFFSPDGDYTGIMEGFPMTPIRDMHPSGDGGITGWRSSLEAREGQYFTSLRVCLWKESSQPETVYWENLAPTDMSSFSSMLKQSLYSVRVAADSSGAVFVAPLSTEEYRILCYGPDGELLNTISMDLSPAERSEAEMEAEKLQMESRMRRMGDHGMPMVWEPDPFRIMIGEMGADSLGNLWVRRGTSPRPLFDVFDPVSGSRLYTVSVDTELDASGWTFSVGPEGVLAWEADAESCQSIHFLGPADP